jgi:predicted outer membrane lipoprotein
LWIEKVEDHNKTKKNWKTHIYILYINRKLKLYDIIIINVLIYEHTIHKNWKKDAWRGRGIGNGHEDMDG